MLSLRLRRPGQNPGFRIPRRFFAVFWGTSAPGGRLGLKQCPFPPNQALRARNPLGNPPDRPCSRQLSSLSTRKSAWNISKRPYVTLESAWNISKRPYVTLESAWNISKRPYVTWKTPRNMSKPPGNPPGPQQAPDFPQGCLPKPLGALIFGILLSMSILCLIVYCFLCYC